VAFGHFRDHGVDFRHVAVGEERRPGMGAQGHHVAGAVVLLVLTSFFMFFDYVVAVVGGGGGSENAGLRMAVHLQPVNVISGGVVPHQRHFGGEAFKRFSCLLVHAVAVDIHALFQIDFRAGDVQKAQAVARRQNCRR